MTAVLEPLPPRDAIASLERRGQVLASSFAYQDVWQDQHQRCFTVAKSAGFDVLSDIFGGVQKALNDGQTVRDFVRDLRPKLEEKGWWGRGPALDPSTGAMVDAQLGSMRRLKTIFDVNMRVSYAQGAWVAFERNKATRPWLRYVALLDGRTRPEHRARHNLCLPVDHPYWNIWAPPCGWNCRCTLQQLSDRDVDRLKTEGEVLSFEPPEDDLVEWVNHRTGTIETVPKGIDPGWAYNPGKVISEVAAATDRLIDAPSELAEAGLKAIPPASVDREFGDWVSAIERSDRVSRRSYVIGTIQPDIVRQLSVMAAAPEGAAIVVDQRLIVHALREAKQKLGRAPTVDMLKSLPGILRAPAAVLRDLQSGRLLYVFRAGDRAGRIVVALDYKTKAAGKDGKKLTAKLNSIRTVDIVPVDALRNPGWYTTLFGMI